MAVELVRPEQHLEELLPSSTNSVFGPTQQAMALSRLSQRVVDAAGTRVFDFAIADNLESGGDGLVPFEFVSGRLAIASLCGSLWGLETAEGDLHCRNRCLNLPRLG